MFDKQQIKRSLLILSDKTTVKFRKRLKTTNFQNFQQIFKTTSIVKVNKIWLPVKEFNQLQIDAF